MTMKRRFMLDRPERLDDRRTRASYSSHGRDRPLAARGSARRGTPLPADERRLLLPLRAERAVGPDAAADARLPLVPRGRLGRGLARGRRGATPRLLRPGDLALVPHGEGHGLRSEPGAPVPGILELEREAVSDRYEILRHGGGGAPTTLICGAVRFDHPAARNLVEVLPAAIHIEAAGSPQLDWMQSTLRLMAAEAKELRPGGEAVITRLGDILVIQAIRVLDRDRPGRADRLARRAPGPADRPRDLADPPRPGARRGRSRRWRASWRCRARPSPPASPSSSASPSMQYVTRWRMHLAVDALREDGATVGELASRLGYRSEAAFARAFKRVIGVPPGAVRRAHQTQAPPAAGAFAAAA